MVLQGLERGAVPVPGLPLPLHLRAAGGAARLQPRASPRVRAQRLPRPDGVGQLQRLRARPPPAQPRPRLALVPLLRGDQLPAVLRQALPLRRHLRRGGGQVGGHDDGDGDSNDDGDRFLALHWSSSYKSRVTTRHASLTVLAIKLAMVLITAAGAAVDTDILQCRYLIFMLSTH